MRISICALNCAELAAIERSVEGLVGRLVDEGELVHLTKNGPAIVVEFRAATRDEMLHGSSRVLSILTDKKNKRYYSCLRLPEGADWRNIAEIIRSRTAAILLGTRAIERSYQAECDSAEMIRAVFLPLNCHNSHQYPVSRFWDPRD